MGKRWVHQFPEYDRELGISYWTKNYLTSVDREQIADPAEALQQRYPYYDPISTLPQAGQRWWAERN